ncbi:trigger factor [Roseospira visakhapatnamensis]|uniref:Trigger factor n=1 Tax=Roseospira visakhapatnamensis TaxID=390880 RepID=A0A7W6RAR3_9PROT|nr:trigger factor [Roseospira visakhapatnamensis]MBB4264882.1 trigger factor [Roseospira visakhapatnamensis]
MQVTETLSEELKRAYTVVVPAATLTERSDAKLRDVAGKIRLPGFRPGKAPLSLLKTRFGASVMGEVAEEAAQEAVKSVVADNDLRPALQPKVEVEAFEPDGGDLTLSITVELLPDFGEPDFSEIELDRDVAEVSDETVDEALQRMAEARRDSTPVAVARAATAGDIAVIDFVGKLDGETFEGGTANDFRLDLGAGQFVPGFEDQVIGMAVDETRTIAVTFPEDYGVETLAGKDTTFDVTLKELRAPVVPDLDDAFAESLGADSLDDLKQQIRDRTAEEYRKAGRDKAKRRLLDRLAERFTQAVPEGLVDVEFDGIWSQLMQAKERDMLEDDDKTKSDDELRAEYRAIAERRVRLGLLLAKVGEDNEISVSQEDIGRAVMERTRAFPGQEQLVLSYYRQNPQALEELRPQVFEDKVVDYILERAKVTERTVSVEDLMTPEDEAAETSAADA